jgi:hypothetical protein
MHDGSVMLATLYNKKTELGDVIVDPRHRYLPLLGGARSGSFHAFLYQDQNVVQSLLLSSSLLFLSQHDCFTVYSCRKSPTTFGVSR